MSKVTCSAGHEDTTDISTLFFERNPYISHSRRPPPHSLLFVVKNRGQTCTHMSCTITTWGHVREVIATGMLDQCHQRRRLRSTRAISRYEMLQQLSMQLHDQVTTHLSPPDASWGATCGTEIVDTYRPQPCETDTAHIQLESPRVWCWPLLGSPAKHNNTQLDR